MRPTAITAAGDDLIGMADEAKAKITPLFATTDVAVRSNPGWVSSSALAACRTAWEQRMVREVEQTATIGHSLNLSATAVSATDAEAARRLNAALGDFGDG